MPHEKSQGAAFPLDRAGHSWLGPVGLAIVIGIAYFAAARLGLALRASPKGTSIFWPGAGIATGALIKLGPNARLPVSIGVITATIVSNLLIGRNVWLATTFGLVNTGQALFTVWLIERWFGSAFKLDDVWRVLGFLVASAAGAAIFAVGAAAAISLVQVTAFHLDAWRVWFASCLLGTVTIAPLLIGLGETLRELPPRGELIEGTVGLVILAALSVFLISLPQGPWATALPVAFVFPVLLWVAVRCRPVFAAAAAFVVTVAIIWSTTFNMGHFGDLSIPFADRILAAQTFVLAGALLALILAALFADRRRSEAELKQSKERLQLALDGAELGAFMVDLATGHLECDARAARIHGHNLRRLPLKEAMRFVPHDDLMWINAAFAEAQRTGGVWKAEYRVVHPPDRPHARAADWVALEGSIVRNSQGTPVRLQGVTRDITERKRAEQALAERNAQLALAGKIAMVGSFAFDIDVGIMQVSPGYAAIHGLPEGTEETKRTDWRTRVHPDDLARLEVRLQQDIADRRREHYCEYRIVLSSGEVRWIEARSSIAYDRDGTARRIVGVNIDVTPRKKTELALAERTVQLALAGKAALVGSLAYDPSTEKLQISEGYAAIHGFPEGTTEITLSEWQVGVHPDDRARLEELRSRAVRERRDEYSSYYRIVRSGGEVRWVEGRMFILYGSDGRPQRILGVNIDATERIRAQEHQRTLHAELDHRVKNVLATVRAIVAQTQETNSSFADFVAALDGRIQSLARTHELLSHNQWHGVSLAAIVQRELAPYTSANPEIGGPSATLKAEAAQAVAMVLHELATNAAKYGAFSNRGGRLLLRWWWQQNGSHGQLAIEWQEVGGPPVLTPSQSGYGTSIIRELIPFELGGTVDLDFASDGVQCRLEIPSDWVSRGSPLSDDFQIWASAKAIPRN